MATAKTNELIGRIRAHLESIRDGSDHTGRWLDADGTECEEDDEGARWEEFSEEEQAAWLESVAAEAAQALQTLEELSKGL